MWVFKSEFFQIHKRKLGLKIILNIILRKKKSCILVYFSLLHQKIFVLSYRKNIQTDTALSLKHTCKLNAFSLPRSLPASQKVLILKISSISCWCTLYCFSCTIMQFTFYHLTVEVRFSSLFSLWHFFAVRDLISHQFLPLSSRLCESVIIFIKYYCSQKLWIRGVWIR